MVEKSAANRFLAGLREQLKAAGTAQEQRLMPR
jgi:hypothetical protein